MSDSQDTDRFLHKVKSTLNNAVDELDGATQTRLHAARRAALSLKTPAKARAQRPAWLYPVGGLATAATVAVLSVSLWLAPPPGDNAMPPLEDLALLSDAEELEFYENLEFYLWLGNESLNNENLDDQLFDDETTG